MTRYHCVDKTRAPMLFSLSLITLLVACGDGSGPLDAALQAQNATGTEPTFGAANPENGLPESESSVSTGGSATTSLGTPPTEIKPSISAAQLFNDNTNTVSYAQSVAFDGKTSAESAGSAAVDTAAASGSSAPSAPATAEQTSTSAENSASQPLTSAPSSPSTQTPLVGLPETPTETANTAEADTNAPNLEQNTQNSANAADQSEQGDMSESAAPSLGAAEPENTGEVTVVATFTGSNTPSFVGELNSDQTVRLTWEADPTARGYNVYRDAGYLGTVFDTTYLDDFEAFDQNYYYEIQAFDFEENYSTIATGLTVEMTGTNRTDPNAPQVDEDLLNNYELVFSDEFNESSLDTSKWNTAYLWGDELIINSELQHYVDIANDPDFGFNPFTFDGESLTINTIRTPSNLLEKANGQQYLSGVITSYDAFKFTYGYVEARAQVPVGKGYWPAFWLLNAYYDLDKPEIDIMEFIGDNQDTVYHTYHYYDAEGNLRSTKSEPTFPVDFSADFHTFGVEWQPGKVTFYVDGIARHTIADPKMSQEQMYIIANTAVGGWWPGDPDETTKFPGEYKIDYIRAYQRVGVQEDPPQFENPDSQVPVRGPGSQSSPSHLPPFELWPNGFPERQP